MKTSLTRRSSHKHILSTSAAALIGVVAVATSYGQAISITGATVYTQNFDTLPTAASNWTDNGTIVGWQADCVSTFSPLAGGLTPLPLAIYTTGAAGARGFFSAGAGTERALALSPTTTNYGANAFGVVFQNNSGSSLSLGNFSYNGELYVPHGTANNVDGFQFFYQISATAVTDLTSGGAAHTNGNTFAQNAALVDTGWTRVGAFDYSTSNAGTAALATPLTTAKSGNLGLTLAPGQFITLRWRNFNDTGTDAVMGIDDVSATFSVIPDSIYNLTHTVGTAPNGSLDLTGTQYWTDGVNATGYLGGGAVLSQNPTGTATIDVPANITVGFLRASNASGTYSVGGVGQISGGLFKQNAGTLALTSANAFSSTSFDGGTIQVSGAGALGTGTITMGAAGGTLANTVDYTLNNVVAGTGTLTKAGAGTLTLGGTNTHSSTTLAAGTTVLGGSFPVNHTLNVNSAATLRVSGTVGTGSTSTIGGHILGTGTVNGTTTISNGGRVESGALGIGTLTFQNLTFGAVAGNAATFDASLAASVNVTGSLVLNGGAGKVTINIAGNPVGALPQTFTLLDYVTIGGSGFGGFVLGTQPNRAVAGLIDDTTNTRVDYQITAIDFPIWSGSLSGAWALGVQGGAENWVLNSNNTSPTDFRVNDNVVFNDLPAADQNVAINGANVTVTSLTFTNATRNYTFSGTNGIAGNAPLVKSGAATVTFNNTNSFTGSVTVNAGTVKAASLANGGTDSALGSGTLVTLDGGSTLEYTGASAASTNRALTINAGGGTIKTANTLTLSGAISGAGTLTKTGAGRVIIAGTASATTTIAEGVLELGAGANVTGALTVNNNTDLEISDGSAGTGNIINNGRTTIRRTDVATIPAIISGSGELIMNGTGSITLGGAAVPNTFTGITRVLAGILLAGKTAGTNAIGGDLLIDGGNFRYAAVAGSANQIPDTANITLTSGSFGDVLNVGPVAQQTDIVNNVTVNGGTFGSLRSGTAALFQVNGTLSVGAAGTVLFQRGGGISANATTAAAGAVFNFDGGSTTGATAAGVQDSRLIVGAGGLTVTDGTFNFNAGPSAFTASTSAITGSRGSRIQVNGTFTSIGTTNILRGAASLATIAQDRSAIELNSAVRTFDVTGTLNFGTLAAPLSVRDGNPAVVVADPIPAPGGILKAGAGLLYIPGNQPYTGTTTINAGSLAIDGTLSTSSVTINGTGTLTGKGSTVGGVTVNTGGSIVPGVSGAGTLTFPTLTLGGGAADTSTLTFNRGTTPGIISVVNTDGLVVNSGANSITVNLAGANPGLGQHLLIDYAGVLGGTGITAFKTGTLPNRVATAVVENDAVNTAIVLNITAMEVPIWTGKVSTEWSTATIAAPKNWGLVGQPAATTDFLAQDNVLFDDTATLTDVALTGGDITPNIVRFNNVTKPYTVAGPGAITGTATVTKDGAGLVTLGGIHTYTGAVTMNAGTLQVASVTDVGGSPLGGATSTLVFNGGTLEYTGATDTTARAITLSAGGGTVKTATSVTLGGLITGAGSLTKTGIGATVFTGANTGFNGGLVIKEGTVQFATTDAIGGTTQTVTLDGGALEYTAAGTLDWGAAAQTRVIHTNAAGGTLRVTAGAAGNGLVLTRAGSLTGAGPITKQGVGTLRLVADNVGFTGNWSISDGAVEVQTANGIGSGTATVGTGGILVVQSKAAPNSFALPNNVVLNGGTLQVRSGNLAVFGGDVDVQAPSFAYLRSFTTTGTSQDITLNGRLSGSQSLTIEGNANNTATALIVKNPGSNFSGQFIVNAAQGLTAQPPITGNPLGTGTIALTDARLSLHDDGAGSNGSIAYGNNVTIAGAVATFIDVNRSAGITTGNTIHLGTLGMTSSTLNVTGANGYTVDFAGAADLGPSPTINATTGNISFSGGVNAAGPLTKQGAGKLTLGGTGTATIAGNVSILGGNLAINDTLADTSNVDVISGTLSGSGTVAGNVVVTAATGIVAPGNSAGILSVGGSVTFGAASAFNVELAHGAGPVPIAGTTYDQLNVGTGVLDGTVDITGATLNITTGADFRLNDILFIIVNDGVDAVAGTFANIPAAGTPFFVDNFMFEISYDANAEAGTLHGGNDVALLVPEPGSAALLLGGIGMLMGRRRRKA